MWQLTIRNDLRTNSKHLPTTFLKTASKYLRIVRIPSPIHSENETTLGNFSSTSLYYFVQDFRSAAMIFSNDTEL